MKFNFIVLVVYFTLLPLGCGEGQRIDGTSNDQPIFTRGIRDASIIPEIIPDEPVSDAQSSYDAGIEEDTGADTAVPPEESIVYDYSSLGPHETTETRAVTIVTNCTMNYSIYSPTDIVDPPVVILGHGFARGPNVMTGWANHLSSWGIEVLLPTLCHYNVLVGVDHIMNGQNMTELADAHTTRDVVYAGHSAGGLAAIIAAANDVGAIGVLGLDATDTQDVPGVPDAVGYVHAAVVSCPAFSIIGEPSSCNANNNGVNLFRAMSSYRIVRVRSSDHCDFESPTNFICESSCRNESTSFSDDEIRPAIFALGTAAILSLTGLRDTGWTTDMLAIDLLQELD